MTPKTNTSTGFPSKVKVDGIVVANLEFVSGTAPFYLSF